jgi:hypothetical protein
MVCVEVVAEKLSSTIRIYIIEIVTAAVTSYVGDSICLAAVPTVATVH